MIKSSLVYILQERMSGIYIVFRLAEVSEYNQLIFLQAVLSHIEEIIFTIVYNFNLLFLDSRENVCRYFAWTDSIGVFKVTYFIISDVASSFRISKGGRLVTHLPSNLSAALTSSSWEPAFLVSRISLLGSRDIHGDFRHAFSTKRPNCLFDFEQVKKKILPVL